MSHELKLKHCIEELLELLSDAGIEDKETWQPGQNWIFRDSKIEAKQIIEKARKLVGQ